MKVPVNRLAGPVLQLRGRGELLKHAALHHRDPVGQRVGLGLVMGDEDRGQPALLDEMLDPPAQQRPQLRLQLPHRLVEQMQLRIADQRPPEAGALLLTAGDRARIAVQHIRDLQKLRHLLHTPLHLLARQALRLQREGDVLAHRQRRVERIALEGHRHMAARRRQPVDLAALERNGPLGRLLEARDHAQRRGLAAARGAEQRHDLAFRDGQRHGVDRADLLLAAGAVDLGDAVEDKGVGHAAASRSRRGRAARCGRRSRGRTARRGWRRPRDAPAPPPAPASPPAARPGSRAGAW
jgi:hypothetical protein